MKPHFWIFVSIMICLLVPPVLNAQEAEVVAPVIYSVGMLDEDGTALYSVLLASGSDELSGLTVTAELPEGMFLTETLEMPEAAVLVEAVGNHVVWQVESLPSNGILGPFTYRAHKADAESTIPQSFPATLVWDGGTVTAPVLAGELVAPEVVGEVVLEPTGTLNDQGENVYIPVGNTGAWIFLLPETISESTTLKVTRLPITNLPTDITETWWCAMLSFELNPVIAFTKPIGLIFPTRRVLTPGLAVHMFTPDVAGEWQPVAEVAPGEEGNICTTLGTGIICTVYSLAPAASSFDGGGTGGSAMLSASMPEGAPPSDGQVNFGGGGGFQLGGGGFGGGGIQFGGGGQLGGGQFGGGGGFNLGGGGGTGFGVTTADRAAGYVSSERLEALGVNAVGLLQLLFETQPNSTE